MYRMQLHQSDSSLVSVRALFFQFERAKRLLTVKEENLAH